MPLLVSCVSTGKRIRRGALTGGLCLGLCCLAVFGAGPTPAAPPPQTTDKSQAEGPVFVDEVITAKSTRRSGFAPYKNYVATLDGEMFPRSLMTEVSGVKLGDTLSVLTLKIDGKYERFQATVGRSDSEARSGPAYAYFEVWGDGTCFFRSTPIRSAATMVTVPSGAAVRKTPQAINIVVRGTRTLQLVTRYASTIDQQAPDVTRAHGCIWGDPRLLTNTASAAPATSPAAAAPTVPTPADTDLPRVSAPSPILKTPAKAKTPPQTSPPVKNPPDLTDPRRDSVRMAVLLLASGVGSALTADSPQPLPTLRYPLKVVLLPMRPCLPAGGDRRRRGSAAGMQPTDREMQKMLEVSLPTARRGKASLFTLLESENIAELTRLLAPSLMTAIVEPTTTDMLPLASFCRAKRVDAILIPTLLPGSGTTTRNGFRLDLRLFDAASGLLIARSVQIISSPRRN